MMSEDMSVASGTSPVSGYSCHCVPKIVLFEVMCTYGASGFKVKSLGMYEKFLSSEDPTTFTSPKSFASFMAFFDHVPVFTYSAALPGCMKFMGIM